MSPRAAWLLEALGFTDVSHYLGGISDWSRRPCRSQDISRRSRRSWGGLIRTRPAASRRDRRHRRGHAMPCAA